VAVHVNGVAKTSSPSSIPDQTDSILANPSNLFWLTAGVFNICSAKCSAEVAALVVTT